MRLVGIVGLLVVGSLCAAQSALACSCAGVPPGEQLRQSDGAVVARLLAIRPVDDGDDTGASTDPTDFVYRTGRVIKNRPRLRERRRLAVRSVRSDASCGLSGKVGDLTGLFLTRDGRLWRSGSCQQITAGQMRRLERAKTAGHAGKRCTRGLAALIADPASRRVAFR